MSSERPKVRYVKASVYLPEPLAEALGRAYPEVTSLGEAVRRLVYECLAGVLEIREFPEEAMALAASELLRMAPHKYAQLIHVAPKTTEYIREREEEREG